MAGNSHIPETINNPIPANFFIVYLYSTMIDKIKDNSKIAFAVFPDSEAMDLASENKPVAVFKYEKQAIEFGKKMWENFYLIKPIVLDCFG